MLVRAQARARAAVRPPGQLPLAGHRFAAAAPPPRSTARLLEREPRPKPNSPPPSHPSGPPSFLPSSRPSPSPSCCQPSSTTTMAGLSGLQPIGQHAQRLLVGLVGVGNMGSAMATRLLGAGAHRVDRIGGRSGEKEERRRWREEDSPQLTTPVTAALLLPRSLPASTHRLPPRRVRPQRRRGAAAGHRGRQGGGLPRRPGLHAGPLCHRFHAALQRARAGGVPGARGHPGSGAGPAAPPPPRRLLHHRPYHQVEGGLERRGGKEWGKWL